MNVLINEKYLKYDKLSRYSQFPYYYNTLDDKYICGTTAYLDDSTNYILHQVQEGETYDKLSLDAYGNPTYYWVICSYNHIQNPFQEPTVGSYIKLPVISDIMFEE